MSSSLNGRLERLERAAPEQEPEIDERAAIEGIVTLCREALAAIKSGLFFDYTCEHGGHVSIRVNDGYDGHWRAAWRQGLSYAPFTMAAEHKEGWLLLWRVNDLIRVIIGKSRVANCQELAAVLREIEAAALAWLLGEI